MTNSNQMIVVVKGLIFNEGKVLIVKRSNEEEIGGGTWELVGGKIDFGETLEKALLREIKEEVGLSVIVERILYATTFNTDPTRQVVLLTYLCRSETCTIALSNEHTDFLWATQEEAKWRLTPEIRRDFEKNHVFSLQGFQ
jgi:8-oxo-dGTP diphosphatase